MPTSNFVGLQQLAIKIACQGGGYNNFSVEIPTAEISGIGVCVRCLVLGVCKNEITNAYGVEFVSIKHKGFIWPQRCNIESSYSDSS